MHEFELIELIQTIQSEYKPQADYIALGIGDDCAALQIPENHELLITTDTLVEGVHFNHELSAEEIGHKSLAVNLSDIAAMGAKPVAATLNLTLPAIDQAWITKYLHGFFSLAKKYNVALIGGDLTKGPLSISIAINGIVKNKQAIKRSGAQVGDNIYVSGALGEAAYILQNNARDKKALHAPEPHIELGQALSGIANAMIDISDGLSSDLQHILKASNKGAIINAQSIPLGSQLQNNMNHDDALVLALNGGEDYVLCFTVSPEKRDELKNLPFENITEIGVITEKTDFLMKHHNSIEPVNAKGYNHFNDK